MSRCTSSCLVFLGTLTMGCAVSHVAADLARDAGESQNVGGTSNGEVTNGGVSGVGGDTLRASTHAGGASAGNTVSSTAGTANTGGTETSGGVSNPAGITLTGGTNNIKSSAAGGTISSSSISDAGGIGHTGGFSMTAGTSGASTVGGTMGIGGSVAQTGGIVAIGGSREYGGSSPATGGGSVATGGSSAATGGVNAATTVCALDCQWHDISNPCVCGDGIVQQCEQCDDGNSPYPGCSDTCQLEKGYTCPFAGAPCVTKCGDGIIVKPAEQCDPGSNLPSVAQSCNSDCSVKPGWACDENGCHQTKCGDGIVEGSEGCDPGKINNDLGDGCSPTCMAEPNCPAGGGGCTTMCGDGLILGSEQCDDGNAVSGDGCSSDCRVEPGFTCGQPPLGDTIVVPMVVRDFNAGADFEKGSSFATGLYWANQGLLKTSLDANGLKPQLNSTTGTMNGKTGQDSGIASGASFAQWYSDSATGPNTYRGTLATSLNLYLITNSDPPTYVNRYGTNGDGLTSAQYQQTSGLMDHFCGIVGQEDRDPVTGDPIPCTYCPLDECPNTPECDQLVNGVCTPHTQSTDCTTNPNYLKCYSDGKDYHGVYVQTEFDGNPLFFPADAFAKPWSPESSAQIAGNYDPSWPMDPVNGRTHNFSFTTESRFWFKYGNSKPFKLMFVGDDDVWIFINKKLAVDLGGIHTAVQGTLVLTNGNASVTVVSTWPTDNIVTIPATTVNLGLQDGQVYEIAVFQAQRQTKASSFQLSLSGFNAAHSVCKPECGGTNPAVTPGEQCDDGNAGNCDPTTSDCYNKCTVSCTWGPRCGDGVVQADRERCDPGS